MARYEARFIDPIEIKYRDATLYAPSGLTAGPTLQRVLTEWKERLHATTGQPGGGKPAAEHYATYAVTLDNAYRHRLQTMGASDSETRPSCTSHFCVSA